MSLTLPVSVYKLSVFFTNLPVIKSPIKNQITTYVKEIIPKEIKPIKAKEIIEKTA